MGMGRVTPTTQSIRGSVLYRIARVPDELQFSREFVAAQTVFQRNVSFKYGIHPSCFTR